MIKRINALLICFTVAASLFSFTAAAQSDNGSNTYEKPNQSINASNDVKGGNSEAPEENAAPAVQMPGGRTQEYGKTDPRQQYRQDQMPDMNGKMPVAPEFNGQMPFQEQSGDRRQNEGMGRGQGGERFPNIPQSQIPEQKENTYQDDTHDTLQNNRMTFKEIFKTYPTPIFSVFLLAAAFIFVIFYKRKTF